MKQMLFKGVGTAIITPFLDNSINYDEFQKIIEFQIENGADSIIVCGTTGESSTMTTEERKYAIRFVVNTVNKRIPVIAGTGSSCTKTSIELSIYAEAVGADGLLIVTPYYNKTTQDGIVEHYKTIANSTKLPIIIYNVPSRTGLNILPSTYKKLIQIDNVVGIKEASGDISQVAKIANLYKDELYIYSGNDDMILPILALGGHGAISVVSNIIPKDTKEMITYFENGDIDKAIELQQKIFPLITALFSEVNPIPVKAALGLMGYQVGTPRLPLVEISKDNKSFLEREMKLYGLL